MNHATPFLSSFPRKARVTPSAPHLVTTVYLEDALVALRTLLGIVFEHLDRLLVFPNTFVLVVFLVRRIAMTIGTELVLTKAALKGGGHSATAFLSWTRHEKHGIL